LHRCTADRAEFLIARSLVHDGRVVVSDIGDVGRLINNRHAAFWRQQGLLNPRRAKFSTGDKTILVGTNVVVTVGPVMNAGALIESRFRRQRGPADVIVALAP